MHVYYSTYQEALQEFVALGGLVAQFALLCIAYVIIGKTDRCEGKNEQNTEIATAGNIS